MNKEQIIEAIESMTVLELSELVKALEEKFGVSAAAPVAVAAAPAAGRAFDTDFDPCGHPAGDGGAAAYPPGQRQRGFGCGQRNHADLRPRQRHRAHGGGDAGKHGDDLLYRGGILRGGGDTPHPPHHSGGHGSGYYGLSGRGVDGAMGILEEEIGGTWKVSGQRCLPLRIIGECVKAGRRGRRSLQISYKLCGEAGRCGHRPLRRE